MPFVRGPDELKDLPAYFGRARRAVDMTSYDIQIFAEIVDASALLGRRHREARAKLCPARRQRDRSRLPARHALSASRRGDRDAEGEGLQGQRRFRRRGRAQRGGKAGADYLLSLNEETLHIADEVASIPVLIPKEHGDMASLYRAMDALDAKGRSYLVDPVLDPINFGFMRSLERYAEVRRKRPDAEILMGTGNLTELTDADTTGITAVLLGIASELHIRNVLVVQVSPHTRRTVEEHDLARRIMYASRAEHDLPKDYADGLLALHSRASRFR